MIESTPARLAASLGLLLLAQTAAAQTCGHRLFLVDPLPGDGTGWSVAIDGDVAWVGYPSDGPFANHTGSVRQFGRDPASGIWHPAGTLMASDAGPKKRFGTAVDFDGEWAAVGSAWDGQGGQTAGAAYLFRRDAAGAWTEHQKVIASDAHPLLGFGHTLDLEGERMIVGVIAYDDGVSAAYVFDLDPATGDWIETERLFPADGEPGDDFGRAVALDGDRALVGSPFDDDGADRAGSAYVFDRDPQTGAWMESAKLRTASPFALGLFGYACDLDGDRALVGAPGQADGEAYLFERDPATGVWSIAETWAPTAPADLYFGYEVLLAGDRAWVTALETEEGGTIYPYERDGASGVWGAGARISAATPIPPASHGHALATDGQRLAVGSDSSGPNDGSAAYVYFLAAEPVGASYCGPAVPNSTGVPAVIEAHGSATLATGELCLLASSLPPGEVGYFLTSRDQGFVSGPGGSQGNLCLGGGIGRYNGAASTTGPNALLTLEIDLVAMPTPTGAVGALVGETWNFQAWYRDTNPSSTSNFTDAVGVTLQ